MTIRIYTAKNCKPCKELEELLKGGQLRNDVELIDIETDEGFRKFKDEVLDHGDGAVPSAYKDGRKCAILIDENENLQLECPTDDLPSSREG